MASILLILSAVEWFENPTFVFASALWNWSKKVALWVLSLHGSGIPITPSIIWAHLKKNGLTFWGARKRGFSRLSPVWDSLYGRLIFLNRIRWLKRGLIFFLFSGRF